MIDEATAQRFFSQVNKESGRMYNGIWRSRKPKRESAKKSKADSKS